MSYFSSLRGEFTLDDWDLIVKAPVAQSLAHISDAFGSGFLPELFPKRLAYYRPLITVSWQLNHALTGPEPFGFRLVNLLLHIAVALMVLALARRITGSLVAAGIAGLAFAVLPGHAESVAWISGRTDILSTLFALAALMVFASASISPAKQIRALAIAALLFAGALLSKENALVLPALIALYAWFFPGSLKRRDGVTWTAGLMGVALIYLIAHRLTIGSAIVAGPGVLLKERLICIGVTYAAYMRMLFIPQPACVAYDVFPVAIENPAIAIAAWLIPIGLVALAVYARKKAPVAAFGCAWIFITLLPVSNIMPISSYLPQERYIYMASIGSASIIGWAALKMIQWRPGWIGIWPVIAGSIICLYMLCSAAFVVKGSACYSSNLAWASAEAATGVRFAFFRATAGNFFLEAGKLSEADREYTAALQHDPGHFYAQDYLQLAKIRRKLGEAQSALDVLKQGIARYGDNADLQTGIGITLAKMGNRADAQSAFTRAVQMDPANSSAWFKLGWLHFDMGKWKESVDAYEQAMKLARPSEEDRTRYESAIKHMQK